MVYATTMKSDLRRILLAGLAVFSAAGCELGAAPIIPGGEADGSVVDAREPDAAAPPDAMIVPDAEVTPDVVVTPDATVTPDAVVTPDVAVTPDVTVTPDVVVTPDVTVTPDVVVTPDATVTPDAMVMPDVVVRPDVVVMPDVVVDVPVDRATPDAGTTGGLPDTTLMVPTFDAATVAHIREVRARGVAMGMRPNVFAKIGDSITESASFLSDIGFGWYTLGGWSALEPTVRYFSTTPAVTGSMANSFNRQSVCAMGGWIAAYALSNDPDSALRRELNATRPAYAMVMYGTNDLDYGTVATYRTNMNRILDVIESYGTVAALSTIPDRLDRADSAALVPTFNAAIRDIAATRHLPLMEFWGALQPLPRRGVDPDGIHPSAYVSSSGGTACGVLTDAGLRFGYNMRNLVALALLERLRNTL